MKLYKKYNLIFGVGWKTAWKDQPLSRIKTLSAIVLDWWKTIVDNEKSEFSFWGIAVVDKNCFKYHSKLLKKKLTMIDNLVHRYKFNWKSEAHLKE